MRQDAIPVIELEKTDLPVSALFAQYQGQTVGFQLPQQQSVLLLLPSEDYNFVNSAIQARKVLPTRPSRTPAEYFAETVGILHRLEQKHGTSSAEFYRKFQEGAIQEGPADYWEWRVRYKSFLTMKERFGFSETEVEDA